MKKLLLFALGAMMAMPSFAQEEDVTNFIQNAGFDEDLTWQADGSKKEIIRTEILNDNSIAAIAADSSLYTIVNPSTSRSRPDGRTLEATNGFVGMINGWEWVNTNNATKPHELIESKACEWVYYGALPYDLRAETIPVAADGNTYLIVPAKPENNEFEAGVGALYLRAGWGCSFAYKQTVKLPCAKYRLEYWTINVNPNTMTSATDLSKITCRQYVFQEEGGSALTATEWTKHEFEFTPTAEFTLQFGFKAGNSGSIYNPWVFIDGIKLFKIGEAEVQELQYNLNSEDMTAEVTYGIYSGNVVIPSVISFANREYRVTAIGTRAFSGCTGLTSVTIPNSVTNIGDFAFEGCTGLTSVTIPNSVTSMGNYAFEGCTGLTSVTIGNSVTGIGGYAFRDCSNLTSVTLHSNAIVSKTYSSYNNLKDIFGAQVTDYNIGDGVTSIGSYAFYGCSHLISVTIPNSVTNIGNCTFSGCTSLTSVTLNSNAIVSKTYTTSNNLKNIFGEQVTEYNIGDDVTGIGSYAFSGCSGLTSITIPNSVTSIGDSAFYGCSSLTSPVYNETLFVRMPTSYSGSYTIPNGIKEIIGEAFRSCATLTSITIPNSVTSIGGGVFSGCSSLASITVESGNTKYDSRDNCNAVIEAATNTLIVGCKNTSIPNSVTSIGDSAFWDCTSLTSITIPNSVTNLGTSTFSGCKLKNVMLKHQTPPTITRETFSVQTCYHATLYVPAGTWESYAYDDGWYSFINIRETATETSQIVNNQAYTLMDAKSFVYVTYDPVNNEVGTIPSTSVDENNPNHSWQTIAVEGKQYLYNIGAKKFAVPTADGKGLMLSDIPSSLSIKDGNDGLLFDNQTDKQWAMVVNDKTAIDDEAIETVLTAISTRTVDASPSAMVSYNLNGLRQNAKQKGLNIIRMSDGTVKKVMVK